MTIVAEFLYKYPLPPTQRTQEGHLKVHLLQIQTDDPHFGIFIIYLILVSQSMKSGEVETIVVKNFVETLLLACLSLLFGTAFVVLRGF